MKRQVIGCVLFGAPDPLPPVKDLSVRKKRGRERERERERVCVYVCERERERASAREVILSLQVFPETAAEVARSLD